MEFSDDYLLLMVGEQAVVYVTAVYPDGRRAYVTGQCTLISDNPAVAEVKNGVIIARGAGTARIYLSTYTIPADPAVISIPDPIIVHVEGGGAITGPTWTVKEPK